MQEEKKKEFFPIHTDLIFKNLFGIDKNIKNTTTMLEALFELEKGSLDGSTITNSVILDKETVLTKKFELDIKLKDPYGNIYNLEMQRKHDRNSEIKNLIYLTGIFFTNITPGEMYNTMKKSTQIEFIKKDTLHKSDKLIKKYAICNVEDIEDKILEDLFGILIIDVDQDRDTEYNENSEFEKWRRFIGADTQEELEKIAESDPQLEEALKESLRFMEQEYVQDFSREELLQKSRIETAKNEGKLEGEKSKVLEIAKEMLNDKDISLEKVSKFTGLTIEKLEKIKKDIN